MNAHGHIRRHTVAPAGEPPPADGDGDGGPWATAEALAVDQFPWYECGKKQSTTVRMLYDPEAIYLQFLCQDVHISAEVRELNGSVCRDSCVEFFAAAHPADTPDYFNLEINCCGTMLMGFGDTGGRRRKPITSDQAAGIRIATSVPGPTKRESADDDGWWVVAVLPFDLLSEFTGRTVRPTAGDLWLANLYRCGGKTDPQYACWNPIDLPHPDFHCLKFFGELHFA